MSSLDPAALRENLRKVRERIGRAAELSGRDPGAVQIMAVTKTHPAETVRTALGAGLALFGENRIQEAEGKYIPLLEEAGGGSRSGFGPAERFPGRANEVSLPVPAAAPGFKLHLVGHLQRNKARIAAGLFDCVQSIDKYETAEVLDRHCAEPGRIMDVLLELNTTGEESKFGFGNEEALHRVLERILELEHLRVRGLMTVGPFSEEQGRIRAAFVRLGKLFTRLRDEHPQLSFDVLSMGMSGDFDIAVQEGATMVRLGTALFGPRTLQGGL